MNALNVLCAQLTRDLFVIAKFLFLTSMHVNSAMTLPLYLNWPTLDAVKYTITANTFLHLSCLWTLFAFGFVKIAWLSTQQNQSPFCLAHQKGWNLFPVWNSVTSLVQTSNSDKVKILGATLDFNITMEPHSKALSRSCFYHIRSFKQICSSLDDGMAVSVASALVSSRLDQVHSILYGAASKHKSPSARPECAGKSRYRSAPIRLSTLIHCITRKPPLATHWMASTFQTGHLGI